MKNVKCKVEGNKLTVEIDLSERHGKSSTGKSETVATTAGNIDVAPGIKLGLNVFAPVSK